MALSFDTAGLEQSDVAVAECSVLTTNEHANAAEAALSVYDGQEEEVGDEQESGELLADNQDSPQPLATDPPPTTIHSPEVPATTKEKEKAAAATASARATKRAEQLHQIKRKEGDVASASVRWARLQAQTKRAKKHFDLIVEELSDLQDELGGDCWGSDDGVDDDSETAPIEIDRVDDGPINQDEQSPATATVSPLPANTSIAWRVTPTTALNLTGIRGLGEKKLDELIATCPTVGALEDMRASFGGLRNLKGIGEKTSDEIENRIMDWLSKNRDAAVLSEVSSTALPASDHEPAPAQNNSENSGPVDLSDL